MTVDEIFSKIAQHMIEGIMIHSQMSDYFNFLGLKGYSECHKYHFIEENANYIKICDYYIEHFNKLIIEKPNSNPNIIPDDWYSYYRINVDNNIRKTSVEVGFNKWVEWEHNTKTFYQNLYDELISLKEIAAAEELKKYILDVDDELAEAEQMRIELKAIGYNMNDIVVDQGRVKRKYKKRIKEIHYD